MERHDLVCDGCGVEIKMVWSNIYCRWERPDDWTKSPLSLGKDLCPTCTKTVSDTVRNTIERL